MDYNSIKRVFGEATLELKLLFMLGAGLSLIIFTAFYWCGTSAARLVYEQNRDSAQLVLQEHIMATHVGSFRAKLIGSGSAPASAQVNEVRHWIEMQEQQFGKIPGKVDFIYSYDHPGAGVPDDAVEAQICQKFVTKPVMSVMPGVRRLTEYSELIDEHQYRYFEPIRAEGKCLTSCHAPPLGSPGNHAIQEGDVMATAKVTFSMDETRKKLNHQSAILWTYAISTVFFSVLTSYVIVHYLIVKRPTP